VVRQHTKELWVDDLPIGSGLSVNLYDHAGVLLLRAGAPVTPELIAKLRKRGTYTIVCRPTADEPAPEPAGAAGPDDRPETRATYQTDTSRRLDEIVDLAARRGMNWTRRQTPPAPRLVLSNLREELHAAREHHDQAVTRYTDWAGSVIRGAPPDVSGLSDLLLEFVRLIRRDRSIGALASDLQAAPGDYLYQHGVNVAVIALTVATHAGFHQKQVLDAGIGAMLHDIGMLRVPYAIRTAARKLLPEEWMEIERHPIHTADVLDHVPEITPVARLVSYQTHERCDRSGYPRRRPAQYILPLARIVAVADAYVALSSWRPYRVPMSPYKSVERILYETQQGRFDPEAVRAFLNCMSLFPLGSYVRLSNDTVARVFRSNGPLHTRPVVVPLDDNGEETSTEIDLAHDDTVRIVDVLDAPLADAPSPLIASPTAAIVTSA